MTAFFFKAASVCMEYGMLLFLLAFVARLSRVMFRDIRAQRKTIRPSANGGNEAALIVVEAQEPGLSGRRFSFRQELAIGRGPDNDVVIPENFVSHHHAVIFRKGNLYAIRELGSRNPILLNGQPLKGTAYLKNGDFIRVGFVTLRFER